MVTYRGVRPNRESVGYSCRRARRRSRIRCQLPGQRPALRARPSLGRRARANRERPVASRPVRRSHPIALQRPASDRGDSVGVVADPHGRVEGELQVVPRLQVGHVRCHDGGDSCLERRDREAVRLEPFARHCFRAVPLEVEGVVDPGLPLLHGGRPPVRSRTGGDIEALFADRDPDGLAPQHARVAGERVAVCETRDEAGRRGEVLAIIEVRERQRGGTHQRAVASRVGSLERVRRRLLGHDPADPGLPCIQPPLCAREDIAGLVPDIRRPRPDPLEESLTDRVERGLGRQVRSSRGNPRDGHRHRGVVTRLTGVKSPSPPPRISASALGPGGVANS